MKKYLFLFLFTFFLKSLIASHLTDTLILKGEFSEGELKLSNRTIEILEDKTSKLKINDFIIHKDKFLFQTNEEEKQTNKNSESTYWIKFYTRNHSIENTYIFDIHSPNVNKITLFTVDSNGDIIEEGSTGLKIPFNDRDYKDKNLLLNLTVGKKGELLTHFVKVDPNGYCRFNFAITSYPFFMYFSKTEFFCLGIFYGFILIMMGYNLMMFVTVQGSVYIMYIALLFVSLLRTLAWDRIGSMYFWTDYPELSYQLGIYIAPNLILLIYILFTFSFLKIRWNEFSAKIIYSAYFIYLFSYLVLLNYHGDNPYVTIFYFLPFAAVVYVSFLLQNKKRNISWYYLIGTIALLFTVVLGELRHHKLIFGGLAIVYNYHISLVFQSLLFSFSIFDNFKKMNKSREILIGNAFEQDKLHLAALEKIHYFKMIAQNLKSQIQMLFLAINKIILSKEITNEDIDSITLQSKRFNDFETVLNKNGTDLFAHKNTIQDIVEITNHILSSFSDLTKRKEINFEFISTTKSFFCVFEQIIVEKLIFNLLLNAINQSDKYEKIKFKLEINEQENKIIFEIEDNSEGMSDDEVLALNNNTNKSSFVGMGLEFVFYLVQSGKGTISIESELHKGTLITVHLPFSQLITDNYNIINETSAENPIEIDIPENIAELEVVDKYLEQFIVNARKIVEENLSNPELNVDDICKGLGVSRAQLYRKFKSYKQLTVKEFVKEVRLNKAAELLLNTNMNVNETMYEVGFLNRQYFTKCFKEQFDETPSNYKSKVKGIKV